MPTRSAFTPRARPARLTGFALFPESKIERRLLAVINLNSGPGKQIIDIFTRQLPVTLKALQSIIDIAIDGVGHTFLFQLTHQINDLFNMIGRPGLISRPEQAQLIHINIKLINILLGQSFPAHPAFIGTVDNLIIDISKISHKCNIVTPIFKITVDNIENHQRAGMADMT